MTFVGTRPEVPKYVEKYSEEMRAIRQKLMRRWGRAHQ